jgi:hypothetical protein
VHDFEKDIGVREHEDMRTTEFERSFDSFLEHTRKAITANHGHFKTVRNKTAFNAEFDEDGNLWLDRSERRGRVDPNDLYEVWSLLLRGPVTRRQLPGSTRDWDYYLFAVLSQLPYVRMVELAQREGAPALAIELVDDREAAIVANARNERHEWA